MKIDFTHVPVDDLVRALDEQARLMEYDIRDGTVTADRQLMMLDEIRQGLAELKRRMKP